MADLKIDNLQRNIGNYWKHGQKNQNFIRFLAYKIRTCHTEMQGQARHFSKE